MSHESKGQKNESRVDPNQMPAMYGSDEEDEFDLLAYWKILWKKRWLILVISLIGGAISAGYAVKQPNVYRAQVLLAPVNNNNGKQGMSSMLGGLGGLASLAGVSLGGGGSVYENIAVLKSRTFIWGFVKDENLLPILFADSWDTDKKQWIKKDAHPSLWDAWRLFVGKGLLSVSFDEDSGLVHLGVEWTNPKLTAEWAMKIVKRMNSHSRDRAIKQSHVKLQYLQLELRRTEIEENRQALYELISAEQKQAMLANTQHDFVFRVIDSASVPDRKVKPRRSLLVVAATIAAGFLGIFLVLIQDMLQKNKEKEEEKERQKEQMS